ncbi:MAG: DNA mismatch endonuclease Vsr [Gemmatimonadales bacterium]|nr:DNA mismatch endonuclease Vsr [Gemmatimonadales bacterium]
MTDVVDRATRSRMMSGIRSHDTKPELAVRSWLHRAGLRFRLHVRDLPGSPDIVLPRWGAVVFVHGCFWHRHRGCARAATPKTRRAFWAAKFRSNIERDERNRRALRRLGWRTRTIWECSLGPPRLDALVRWIRSE